MINSTNIDKPLYEVNIDFDDASNHWRENKKSIGNGCFVYRCARLGIHNNRCILRCLPGEDYCATHLKMYKAENKHNK
jgi:hypothetical protein